LCCMNKDTAWCAGGDPLTALAVPTGPVAPTMLGEA
jgi:hypothetical protein